MTHTSIVWFRHDLRLFDNPALCAAVETGRPIIALYILDDDSPGDWRAGSPGVWAPRRHRDGRYRPCAATRVSAHLGPRRHSI